nr:MAG TPA: hypothetical protein [Caudoviricetes sp.]
MCNKCISHILCTTSAAQLTHETMFYPFLFHLLMPKLVFYWL